MSKVIMGDYACFNCGKRYKSKLWLVKHSVKIHGFMPNFVLGSVIQGESQPIEIGIVR